MPARAPTDRFLYRTAERRVSIAIGHARSADSNRYRDTISRNPGARNTVGHHTSVYRRIGQPGLPVRVVRGSAVRGA